MPLTIAYPNAIDALANPDASTYMDDTGFFGDEVIARIHDLLELIETRAGANPAATGVELLKSLVGDGVNLSAWDAYYRRNTVVNPRFDSWNGGTSFTASGPTADGWYGFIGTGGSPAATMSRQSHTLGDLNGLGEPTYFYRHLQSAQATSASPYLGKRYLNVRQFAGRSITVSFWAKCAATTVSVTPSASQNFGTGGSPSTTVNTAATAVTVTTTRTRFVRTIAVPSVTGKTVGSNADSYLEVQFLMPQSATYTVDFDEIKVEDGLYATTFDGELSTKVIPTIFVAASNASDAEKNAAHVVCGGSADQTWLNAALSALSSGRGILQLSTGTFSISGQITTANSNSIIRGSGPGTTIQAVDGAGVNQALVLLANTKCGLEDLTIDGNKASTASRTSMIGVSVTAADCSIRSVWSINSAGQGAAFGAAGVRVMGLGVASSASVGINVTAPTAITSIPAVFVNCHVEVGGTSGDKGWDISASYCQFISCSARACGTFGFSVSGTFNKFVGCAANGNGNTGLSIAGASNQLIGCQGHGNGQYGILLGGADCSVVGCHASANTVVGMATTGSRTRFSGCESYSNTTGGFDMSGPSSVLSGSIAYLNACTGGVSAGVDVNSADVIVSGCRIIQNGSHGIRCVGDRCTFTGNHISDNGTLAAATYSGIVIAANDCYVEANTIRKGTAAANKQTAGININAGANNKVGDNDLYDSGTGGEMAIPASTNTRLPSRVQLSVAGGDTINTTAAETNFATSITFPANTLASIGRTIRVRAWGTYGTLGSGTVTLQLKLKVGTTTLLDFGSITTAISISGRRWFIDVDITIAAIGASGSFECAGHARIPTANDDVTATRPAIGSTTTVDTTASQALQISAQHGASNISNTITMRQFIADVRS